MTTPPSTFSRRRISLAALVLLVAVGIAYKAYWRLSIIDLPAVDLAGLDPAVRRLIEERLNAVRQNRTSAEEWGTLGIVLDINHFDQALACLEQAERLDRDDPRWPHFQGVVHMRSDPSAALPKFLRATELGGDGNAASRLRLAELYLRLGRFEEARGQFEILLKADTNLAPAHLGLARLDFQAGNLAECRRHLRMPLSHPLTTKGALALSAEVHARNGDTAAARHSLASSMEMRNPPEWPDPFTKETLKFNVGQTALVQRAEILCDKNRTPEAIKLLHDVLREYPQSKAAWTLIGWAQTQQGQFAEAEKSLQSAIKLDPDYALPLMYVGIVRRNVKDNAGAKDYLRRAIEKKPDMFEAYFNLAQCLKDEGDRAGAIAKLQTALNCRPYSAPAHAMLGELLAEDQRDDEALFHLREALVLNPNLAGAKNRLEDLRRKQSETKK